VASVSIEPIQYTAMKSTEETIGRSGNLPFQYYEGLPREKLARYNYKKIAEAVSAGKVRVFGAMVEGRPHGLLLVEPLPWDNEVLGINCFSLRDVIVPDGPAQEEIADKLVKFAIDLCASEGGELLVAKTDPVAQYLVRALGLAGFEHMSTLIFYGFDVKRGNLPPVRGTFTYRPFEESDVPMIEDVAQDGFAEHFDRYTLDRRIPRERTKNVHREWVKNSCRGYADQVFVAFDGDKLIGFGTWKFEKSTFDSIGVRIARYDLGAVLPEYRSQGVFKGMTAAGMQWIGSRVDLIEGPTNIRNYPTQRALTTLGWRLVGSRYNYHRWLK
jgi:GNAT superfamily N-acetyltransferase